MKRSFNNFIDLIINIMGILARAVIIIIVLIIVIDLLSVNLFNYSFPWVLEMSEYLLVFLTFFGAAWLLREDGHIKLDLILNILSEKGRYRLEFVNSIIGFLVSLTLTISGFIVTYNLYNRGVKTEAVIEMPRFLLIVIIPIGFTFLTIQFLRKIIQKKNVNNISQGEGS